MIRQPIALRASNARVALATLTLLAAAACVPDSSPPPTSDPGASPPLTRLVAVRGSRPGIFDAAGRQVVLRGVNFNHLGDYFQSDPSLPTVAPLAADDWDDVAATGASVIRLVTTWSAWQPTRGTLDGAYLERVRAAVAEANARGLYVVIDMHQDAWSKFVFTPRDRSCPAGTRPQIGWDGAPAWATFTDDAETCTPGGREDSPAVRKAWESFYGNRDGVRDELAALWGLIAREFAADAGVAGYDLLNEPGTSGDPDATVTGLAAFYRSAVSAIRAAEAQQGSPGHIVFFEPTVFAGLVPFDWTADPNVVFASHNYFESIGPSVPGLLDLSFPLFDLVQALYQTTLWTGEYGSFAAPSANEEWMARFARLEDQHLRSGGAWWQWEQECGDPHDVAGAWPPSPEWVANQQASCGNARFVVTTCVRRGYARAAPGRITSVADPACDGRLSVTGSTQAPSTADLWIPSDVDVAPQVTGDGLGAVAARRVGGGWRLDVSVAGDYRIDVAP
ncbi:MAG: cellulase family glycosylhydrolase [bacterium]